MDLKKMIKEEISKFVSENMDVEAKDILQKVSVEMDNNGVEVMYDNIDWNNNELQIDLAAKKTQLPYNISFYIEYHVTKEGFQTPGVWGSSIETSQAPYGERSEWEMKLIKGEIWEDGSILYEGKELFEKLFKKFYDLIYTHFDKSIQEGEPHGDLEEFIKEEVTKLHNKFLLESEKEMVEKQLKILKEDVEFVGDEGPQPGDLDYHYQEPKIIRGIGKFENIDWQILYETLVANTEYHKTGKVEGDPRFMEVGINDLVGYDGFISREEFKLLKDFNVVEVVGHYPIIDTEKFPNYNIFYTEVERLWENYPELYDKLYRNQSSDELPPPYKSGNEDSMLDEETPHLFDNPNNLKLASGNPLDGRSKQSVINYIYKIYKQVDHGQRYRDAAWENVHKIFDLFGQYGMDTSGGYDAEYNPGGISVDEMTPQWKRWKIDFNFTDNKDKQRTITFVLTAHAGGTVENPWGSYDITFYPIN